MTIKELLKQGRNVLKEKGYEDCNLISKQILSKILNENTQYLLINQEKELDTEIVTIFLKYIDEIVRGKPLQYITNNQEFMGYPFFVNENVLIPQPDTEVVVQNCMDICSKLFVNSKKISILDLCTGSGAIAVSLDKILNKDDNIEVYASDISHFALEVARINNKRLSTNVKFIHSDMFKQIQDKYDLIVSNPPYIETNIIETLPKDVQSEPHLALDGGKDGLYFYKIIAKEASKHLKKAGYLCLEIGYNQAKSIKQLLETEYENIRVVKDLGHNDRCIVAQIKK